MRRINLQKRILQTQLFIKRLPYYIKFIWASFVSYVVFFMLFTLYIVNIPTIFFIKTHNTPVFIRSLSIRINMVISRIVAKYDRRFQFRMGWFDLFDLAFKNMSFKKTRSIITVGGMALGIGAIVFLVSLGYGVQRLVITKVARLDEMKQTDVFVQPGSRNKITDRSIEDFRAIPYVEDVLPLIGLAAKVKYEGSISDVAVYGVTTKYLDSSAVKPIHGQLFKSTGHISLETSSYIEGGSDHEHNSLDTNRANNVAGVSTFKTQASVGSKIGDVEYTIFPNSWLQVRAKPDASSKVIGYTRRVVGVQYGEEYWGGEYFPSEPEQVAQDGSGDWMGKWIKSMVPVWELTNCSKRDNLCEEGKYYPIIDESGTQKYEIGYIWELEVMVNRVIIDNHSPVGEVLGDTASSVASFGIESDGAVEAGSQPAEDAKLEALSDEEYILKLLESSASSPNKESKKVSIPAEAQKEAVVNSAFLKVLGFKDENPVGKEFDVSFIVTGDYLDSQEKVEGDFTSYKIVGVVPGDESPFFYVPLKDVVHLGVKNYSQTKVVSVSKEKLPEIREKIESLGFITASVADTVAQINSLFGTVRLILALLGGVALGVASLGMFNTLTISLLEVLQL